MGDSKDGEAVAEADATRLTDPTWGALCYRGSDGTVVELDYETKKRRGKPCKGARWWFRKLGSEEWYGGRGYNTKLGALIDAANTLGLSCDAWDPQPVAAPLTSDTPARG